MSKQYFMPEEWAVTEDHFQPHLNRFMETIFFTGNGYIGLRGVPEEGAPAALSTPYNYLAPIYDLIEATSNVHVRNVTHCSTNVACANWYGMAIELAGEVFDLYTGKVLSYRRTLDMHTATVTRELVWEDTLGHQTALSFTRFVSMHDRHYAGLAVDIRPLNWAGTVAVATTIDATDVNEQQITATEELPDGGLLCTRTYVTGFDTATAMRARLVGAEAGVTTASAEKLVTTHFSATAEQGQQLRVEKIVAVCTSRDNDEAPARERALAMVNTGFATGFAALHKSHAAAVAQIWQDGDVAITGNPTAQQGIRFCILNMHQSYAGTDPHVNMAAKGLTGPGYGGLYWWDSEIYMMPFFLFTAPEKARQLVLYRFLTLEGARNKARFLGFEGAMFPWVTIDGEERSGDWEYGLLEQHVTAGVAQAVQMYVEVSGDEEFMWKYGVELLIETSRFWASRVTYSERKGKYVINFITGPDEYSVAVDNNCYTNYMARMNMEYAIEAVRRMQEECPAEWAALAEKLQLRPEELVRWDKVAADMYIPYDEALGVLEQDDNFLDRDPVVWRDVPPEQKPTSKWNWDRLMRSQAIKQADVLLLQFIKHEMFDIESKRRNYLYYEPKTTHESSLSPCIHAIIAAEIGLEQDAFNYYLRSSRLDLDDVNGNTDEGLHTANTAGSWLCIVSGFVGMRQTRGRLSFTPHLPAEWQKLAFSMTFLGRRLNIAMTAEKLSITLLSGAPMTVTVSGDPVALQLGETSDILTVSSAGK